MRKFSYVLIAAAVILFGICCFSTGESYAVLTNPYLVNSAPAYSAFFNAIPYGIGITICLVAARKLYKRSSK